MLIYNICDHEETFAETGSQAISYTAGVPAIAAAMLIAKGEWIATTGPISRNCRLCRS